MQNTILTIFDPVTGKSYNFHTDPNHGTPHVDVRQNGVGDVGRIELCP